MSLYQQFTNIDTNLPLTSFDDFNTLAVGTKIGRNDGVIFEKNSFGNWDKVGVNKSSGVTGGGEDKVFIENDQVVTNNYTLSAGKNAGSFGPITLSVGAVVTIPSGAVWSIV